MKETLKKVLQWLGDVLLNFAKKMWQECLKEYLHNQIQELVKDGVAKLHEIHESEQYEVKKKEMLDNIFNKIELPLVLKPFKWLIKKILYNTVEEKIQEALNKLNTIV